MIMEVNNEKTGKYDTYDLKTVADLSPPTNIKNPKFPKFDFKLKIKLNT